MEYDSSQQAQKGAQDETRVQGPEMPTFLENQGARKSLIPFLQSNIPMVFFLCDVSRKSPVQDDFFLPFQENVDFP